LYIFWESNSCTIKQKNKCNFIKYVPLNLCLQNGKRKNPNPNKTSNKANRKDFPKRCITAALSEGANQR
jgi:hypothetical protein